MDRVMLLVFIGTFAPLLLGAFFVYLGLWDQRKWLVIAGLGVAMAGFPIQSLCFDVGDLASGKARYELRARPDGSTAWTFVKTR